MMRFKTKKQSSLKSTLADHQTEEVTTHPERSSTAQPNLTKPGAFTPNNILQLQNTVGNRAVERLLTKHTTQPSSTADVMPIQRVRSGEAIDQLVNLGIARHHLENLSKGAFEAVEALSTKVKNGESYTDLLSSSEYTTLFDAHKDLGDDRGKNRAAVILAGLFKGHGRLEDLDRAQKSLAMVYDAMSPTYKSTKEDEVTTKNRREDPTYSSLTTIPAAKDTIEKHTKMREEWMLPDAKNKQGHDPEMFKDMTEETVTSTNDLNEMEKAAIYDYTVTGFSGDGLASTMKTLNPGKLPTQVNKLKLARSGLNKLPVYSGMTWRGEKENRRSMFVKDSIVGFDKFVSSSTAKDTSFIEKEPLLLQFESIKSGRDIRLINLRTHEYEVLFPPGARFEVTDVQEGDSKTLVILKEV